MSAGNDAAFGTSNTLAARLAVWLSPGRLLLFLGVAIGVWLVFVPLGTLVYISFSKDTMLGPGPATISNFIDAYSARGIPQLIGNSLVFASGTAILTLLMGGGIAWVVERTDAPWRDTFHLLALMSFAIPGLLTTMAWALILSPNIGWGNGLLKSWFGLSEAPFNIYSMGGMIWALSSHYFPLAYLLMGPAFRVLDIRMEEAAVVSGAGNWQVATRVTMPLLRPAILSTLLLLFVRGIESFEVPRLLGMPARIHVMTTEIQHATASAPPKFGIAAALGIGLLLLCVLGVYLYRKATANAEAFATVTGKGYQPTPIRLGGWRWPVAAIVALSFFINLGLPLVTLLWQSFFSTIAAPSIEALRKASLENYHFLIGYPVFRTALKNSALLGVLAATCVTALAFMMAWVAQRMMKKQGWMLDAIAFTPIAIPSVIVGASILFAYLVIPLPVYNTIWILLIAYVTMYLPYGMRFASGGLVQIHRELEEV
ncbi:MAG: Trehalose transport system permease protein SugB, partial [Pseudomonadota bacterium]